MKDRREDSPLNGDLQAQFDAAGVRWARKQLDRAGRPARGLLGYRWLPAALAPLVVIGGAGAAVALHPILGDDGSRGAGTNPPRLARPIPGGLQVAQARAPDPDQRTPPWGIRTYPGPKGTTCLLAGRIVGDRLGRLRDGRFAELDATAQGSCGALADHHYLAIVRCDTLTGGGRTALYGVVDRDVERLELSTEPGRFQSLRPESDGSFLVVRRGTFAFHDNHLRVTRRGRAMTLRLQPVKVC
jgi:hypothetical protein